MRRRHRPISRTRCERTSANHEKGATVPSNNKRSTSTEQSRPKMAPYELGQEGARLHRIAFEMYHCPFAKGTPEEIEYDRGWEDYSKQKSDGA
jgi:hypothetical protein